MKMLPLARSVVDAAAHRRPDPSVIARAFADPATRVLLVHDGRLATTGTGDLVGLDLRSPESLAAGGLRPDDARVLWLFLGEHGGATFLAVLLDDLADGAGPGVGLEGVAERPDGVPADVSWSTLREVGHLLDDRDADLATTAVALGEWHRRSRRCPRCGSATIPEMGGWVRRCPVDGGEEHPRTDAAVIMAVTDHAGRILLGHAAHWAARRYSTLAGFVEPGESLETAVRREVKEEVGVVVGDVAYVASQPWPFPASLMVAFQAAATTTELTVDGEEVTEARWFTREQLHRAVRDGEVLLPMRTSVALALIEQWYGGELELPPAS
jgi:NAD+ diphosphatase